MAVRPPLRVAYTRHPGGSTLAAIYGLENLSRATIAPVVSLAGLEILGSAQGLSVALFIASVTSLVFMLNSGRLIARISRKAVFTLACIFAIASAVFFAIPTDWAFVTANALRSTGAGLVLICVSLYTMDFIPNGELAKVESRKILFAGSTWIVFPALGTYLWANVGREAPFILAGSFAVILLAVFWWLRITEAEQISPPKAGNLSVANNLASYFGNGHMRVAYMIAVARSAAWVTFFTYGPIYIVQAGVPVEWVGLIMGLVVSVLLGSPLIGRFAQWFGVRRAIYYAFMIAGTLFVVIGALPEPVVWAFALFFAASLCMDLLDIVGNLPFMRTVRKGVRVEMTTVFSTWRELSYTLTPGVSALLLIFLPLQGLFTALGLAFVGTGIVVRSLPKRVG